MITLDAIADRMGLPADTEILVHRRTLSLVRAAGPSVLRLERDQRSRLQGITARFSGAEMISLSVEALRFNVIGTSLVSRFGIGQPRS